MLKACIPGCDTLERSETGGFVATVALKIGPVSAKFKGKVELTNVNAPNSYTLNFDGQGGVAGFGKGSADVALLAENGGTKLSYNARAQVGGKMAQIGSRLIDATAGKLTEDFFNAFEAQVREKAGVPRRRRCPPRLRPRGPRVPVHRGPRWRWSEPRCSSARS